MSLTDVPAAEAPQVRRPEPLTRREAWELGERLAHLARLVERATSEALAGCGLTRNAWFLLSELDAVGVGVALPAGEWGTRADLSPSSMSAATDLLDRCGLVKRWRDPGNRRSVLVMLTPAGAKTCDEARTLLATVAPPVCEGLTARDLRDLSDLVARMLATCGASASE
jgi:DNA-binding MarR family transcriptional regulator